MSPSPPPQGGLKNPLLLGYIGGNLFGMIDGYDIPMLLHIEIVNFAMKLAETTLFGAFGAMGGLMVKEAYPFVKKMLVERVAVYRKNKNLKNERDQPDL